MGFSSTINALVKASVVEANMATYSEIDQGLEFGVQLIYVDTLLALEGVNIFFVILQVLIAVARIC